MAVTLAGFGASTLLVCLLAPLAGSTSIHLSRVFDRSLPLVDNVDAQVFFVARLPRVVAAAIVGSGLALSGVVFQALLRNPLASPDTLGVSAGATLGAMLALTAHADVTETFRTVQWLMGSLDVGSYAPILASLVPFGLACAGFATLPRVLDIISLGEEAAEARGVDVVRTERVALVSASLSTGAAVSLGGPILFVGIIVPHIVRL